MDSYNIRTNPKSPGTEWIELPGAGTIGHVFKLEDGLWQGKSSGYDFHGIDYTDPFTRREDAIRHVILIYAQHCVRQQKFANNAMNELLEKTDDN